MLQACIVVALVVWAGVHAGWLLLPAVWRQPLALRVAAQLRARDGVWQRALLRTLLRIVRASSAACSDCGGRARCPAQRPAAATFNNDDGTGSGSVRLIAQSRS